MEETGIDLATFQRQAAVRCNNRAWELWELDAPDPAQREEMIHAAHAAFLHWSEVGKPIHRLRAWMTLAYAHLRGGSVDLAGVFLQRAEQLLATKPEDLQDWDEPFLLDARSRLHEARGEEVEAIEFRRRAEEAGATIVDEGDRDQYFATSGRHRGSVVGSGTP